MKCPNCGGDQYCPCPVCKKRHKEKVVWINNGDLIACGHCGHTMHADQWLDEEMRQYADTKNKTVPEP